MTTKIKDKDMYARAGFTTDEMPASHKEMDNKERVLVEKERADVKEYTYNHAGVGVVFGTVIGSMTGLGLGALSANPIVPLVAAVGGGIAGYQAGKLGDRTCCAHILEDAGEHFYDIPDHRLNRVKDKIEMLQDAQQECSDSVEKRKLMRAEEHFQTVKANATIKKVINPY